MNGDHISILPHINPNPERFRTFTVNFFSETITTTVTATPSVVRKWIFRVLSLHRFHRDTLVVGLGVQWTPTVSRDRAPAATLQLCVGRQCLIFQLLHATHVPQALRRFLADPRATFVGVWNYHDEDMLMRSNHMLTVMRIVDARDVAADRCGLSKQLSMETLAGVLLGARGVRKPREVGASDWDAYWLSPEQVQYACVDAFVSSELGKALNVWNWEN
ncbi:PREDICTED: Werner syndrome ATP-dependent helicase homolog [Theobroma cacao]|uniref:Werner syndrome ATP-dependent helicase homolog n=1 Tax=Theobroma cacao TaxID=3641 RepID=A0AB32VB15_THECC|nr:PREDICTED: Werner syndrome ATP-dependent helicase homolog [Theobroma cacao]